MRRAIRVVAIAATTMTMTFALGACGSSDMDASATPTSASNATSDTITIKNFMFGAPITVAQGAEVTVKNADSTAHTVTADDMSFDTGPIDPGDTATFTVSSKAGTIKFHCDIHNYMTGSIQVTA
jgi:plastocyanin